MVNVTMWTYNNVSVNVVNFTMQVYFTTVYLNPWWMLSQGLFYRNVSAPVVTFTLHSIFHKVSVPLRLLPKHHKVYIPMTSGIIGGHFTMHYSYPCRKS